MMVSSNFHLKSCVTLLFKSSILVNALNTPSFLGSAFPPPRNLLTDPLIATAAINFTDLVNSAVSTGTSAHGPFDNSSTAFSFELYSTSDETPIYEYHYSPLLLADVSYGVKTVDRDTIYRIGSITKLLTVYTFLIQDGYQHWNKPITKYLPELLVCEEGDDSVHRTAWDEITVGALASHMAGVGQEYGWLDISLVDFPFEELGLPPLTGDEMPTCGGSFTRPACPSDEFLRGFAQRDPVFATFQSPSYSNAAFEVLAHALEKITGRDFKTLIDEALFKPLNLSRTSYDKPDDSLGIIPGNRTTTFWNFDLGELWPTGGVWSSTADLSTIGRSILRSDLLAPSQTRRWMKPVTHTSSLITAIGAPWEIQRVVLSSGRIVDLYTKNGKLGSYGGYMILVPDYDVGFTMLFAGPGTNTDALAGFVVDAFLPALEEAARLQAEAAYAGNYVLDSDGSNSSFTLITEPGKPALELTSWINNGTAFTPLIPVLIPLATGDIEAANAALALYKAGEPLVDPATITITLYPTGLRSPRPDGGEIVSFRAVFGITPSVVDTSPFSDTRAGWGIADLFVYGKSGLDEFIFTIDGEGKVVSVENTFLRQTLVKG